MKTETIIVTRHSALVDLLIERGVINGDEEVISHATSEDITGKNVIGVLPLRLASMAKTVTEVPLKLTADDRGKELPIERLREIADDPVTYTVGVVN
jgi:hypothetical protein